MLDFGAVRILRRWTNIWFFNPVENQLRQISLWGMLIIENPVFNYRNLLTNQSFLHTDHEKSKIAAARMKSIDNL
jgi:hypothetical protein